MYEVTRRIGLDAGHRIPDHGSKCRHIHGHRYEVLATCCSSDLIRSGEQRGMTIDFGFLKDEMVQEIEKPCDHSLIICADDALLIDRLGVPAEAVAKVRAEGAGCITHTADGMHIYVIDSPPTAENLARHWFDRLAPKIVARSEGNARLSRIRVYETPNCYADYPVAPTG